MAAGWMDPLPAAAAPALPGPYRGRVVEVFHPKSVVGERVERPAVREMLAAGMTRLTGEKEEKAAWTRFFAPGDRVGIKVCPVGKPRSISQFETVLEIIRSLNNLGIPNDRIVVFDRYRDDFVGAGYDKILPPGVRGAWGSVKYDNHQTDLEGYDPDVWVEMKRTNPDVDANDPVHRRSHLIRVVSREVDKVINVPVLKDHASAGVTMALKNLSHGCVNNVARSHANPALNWCDDFIPTVVGMEALRKKVVLHIGDGLIGTYDGGPGNWNPHFRTWEYRSLFFATDPVAMDRIGWEILDRKRAEAGLPPLAETGLKGKNPGHESFDHRQPQHVLIAGKAGLGEADLQKIRHTRLEL